LLSWFSFSQEGGEKLGKEEDMFVVKEVVYWGDHTRENDRRKP